MAELEIPDSTIADKNHGSKIILDDGRTIEKDTEIHFENLDGINLAINGFYEVRSDDVDTWIHLYAEDSSDTGISGVDMVWQELAERVQYGDAEIVNYHRVS